MDRLAELTKQIRDAIGEIKEAVPVLLVGSKVDGTPYFFLQNESDFMDLFGATGYFRTPVGSGPYPSRVHASINGVEFAVFSKLPVPAGVGMVVVANPERERKVS